MLMLSGEVVGIATSKNLLLGSLQTADGGLLLPHMRRVTLTPGAKLFRASDPIETIYFPEAGVVALEQSFGQSHVEVAIIGREGMLGWPALLGCDRNLHDTIVRGQEGRAIAIALEPTLAACRLSVTLSNAFLRFVQTIMSQMARTIALHRECSLNQRVARWMLLRHDRVGGDQIVVRHEEIAAALNARRPSITDRLHILEGERLISSRRGRVLIRDRDALERFAGDAYGLADYGCFAAPFGKSTGRTRDTSN